MDWTAEIDAYCERLGPGYWAEPLNAVTNAAFLVAAVWMWRRSAGVPEARLLCAVLFAIGVGSFLFHTHATVWAAIADVVPIGVFILIYLFLVNRDVVGLRPIGAVAATTLFFPYAAVIVAIADLLPFFRVSNFYWTVPILLVIYGVALRGRYPDVTRGFLIGAAILSLSITLRSLDDTLCAAIPVGTHIWWHLLNAVMLGWMIEVYRRFRAGYSAI